MTHAAHRGAAAAFYLAPRPHMLHTRANLCSKHDDACAFCGCVPILAGRPDRSIAHDSHDSQQANSHDSARDPNEGCNKSGQ
jgi:hypothetical protein